MPVACMSAYAVVGPTKRKPRRLSSRASALDAGVVAGMSASDAGGEEGDLGSVLARAAYDGIPGHPVLLGREHWAAVREGAVGDRGARGHLAGPRTRLVECGDLATGVDVDSR